MLSDIEQLKSEFPSGEADSLSLQLPGILRGGPFHIPVQEERPRGLSSPGSGAARVWGGARRGGSHAGRGPQKPALGSWAVSLWGSGDSHPTLQSLEGGGAPRRRQSQRERAPEVCSREMRGATTGRSCAEWLQGLIGYPGCPHPCSQGASAALPWAARPRNPVHAQEGHRGRRSAPEGRGCGGPRQTSRSPRALLSVYWGAAVSGPRWQLRGTRGHSKPLAWRSPGAPQVMRR